MVEKATWSYVITVNMGQYLADQMAKRLGSASMVKNVKLMILPLSVYKVCKLKILEPLFTELILFFQTSARILPVRAIDV